MTSNIAQFPGSVPPAPAPAPAPAPRPLLLQALYFPFQLVGWGFTAYVRLLWFVCKLAFRAALVLLALSILIAAWHVATDDPTPEQVAAREAVAAVEAERAEARAEGQAQAAASVAGLSDAELMRVCTDRLAAEGVVLGTHSVQKRTESSIILIGSIQQPDGSYEPAIFGCFFEGGAISETFINLLFD